MYYRQCPIFSSTSQDDLNYCVGKNHSAPEPAVVSKYKTCYQEFPEIYALRQQKNTQNGSSSKTENVHPDDNTNELEDTNLEQELRSCQYFLLDSEHETARQKVFSYAVKSLNDTLVNEKLDQLSDNLKRAAKSECSF